MLAALCLLVVAQCLSGFSSPMPPDRFEASRYAPQPDGVEAFLATSGSCATRFLELRLVPERVADRDTRSGDGGAYTTSRADVEDVRVHGGSAILQAAEATPRGPLYHLHGALLI